MSRLVIFLLKLYQSTPTHLHSACRFTPTCSSYAIESYEKYGFFPKAFSSERSDFKSIIMPPKTM